MAILMLKLMNIAVTLWVRQMVTHILSNRKSVNELNYEKSYLTNFGF